MDLLSWIGDNYILRHGQLREPALPMMVAYIRQHAATILAYKYEAERISIGGSDTAIGCTADMLAEQLRVAVNLLPVEEEDIEKGKFGFSGKPTSLAWKGVQYEVLCNEEPKHRGGC